MGKSGHVGRKIAATLASTGTPALFVHPAEASHGDLGMIVPGDAVLALSNSGETSELADLVAHTRRFGLPLIGITARPQSTLAEAADIVLLVPPAAEACPMGLAPTTSTTMQMALGDALAVALITRRGFTAAEFSNFIRVDGSARASAASAMSCMARMRSPSPLRDDDAGRDPHDTRKSGSAASARSIPAASWSES